MHRDKRGRAKYCREILSLVARGEENMSAYTVATPAVLLRTFRSELPRPPVATKTLTERVSFAFLGGGCLLVAMVVRLPLLLSTPWPR